MYGAAPAPPQGGKPRAFLKPGGRSRLNILPVLLAVMGPWLTFSCLVLALTVVRSVYPLLTAPLVCACVAATAWLGVQVYFNVRKKHETPERYEPNWTVALFFLMVVAVVMALPIAEGIYENTYLPYYETKALGVYHNVDPLTIPGERLIDAGVVNFVKETEIDLSKAMSFWKNEEKYCVAPVVHRGASNFSYDYWAVGVGCCDNIDREAFHCPHYSDANAHSGFRAVSETSRGFFRLAVQQAEATYDITAAHPLFLQWSDDAAAQLETYKAWGDELLGLCMFGFFALNGFLVIFATLIFTKLGHS